MEIVDVGGLFLVETGYDTSLSLLDADSIKQWLQEKCYVAERNGKSFHSYIHWRERQKEKKQWFHQQLCHIFMFFSQISSNWTKGWIESSRHAANTFSTLHAQSSGHTAGHSEGTQIQSTCTNTQMHPERTPAGQFRLSLNAQKQLLYNYLRTENKQEDSESISLRKCSHGDESLELPAWCTCTLTPSGLCLLINRPQVAESSKLVEL